MPTHIRTVLPSLHTHLSWRKRESLSAAESAEKETGKHVDPHVNAASQPLAAISLCVSLPVSFGCLLTSTPRQSSYRPSDGVTHLSDIDRPTDRHHPCTVRQTGRQV
uniref:Uncharacterized protein n=1 Tax=Vitrella brassicaformis TaxID=1169539 RepID=A0A7S1NWR1_9ALVE